MERSILGVKRQEKHVAFQTQIMDVGRRLLGSHRIGQVISAECIMTAGQKLEYYVHDRPREIIMVRRSGRIPRGLVPRGTRKAFLDGFGGGLCPARGQHRLIKKKR